MLAVASVPPLPATPQARHPRRVVFVSDLLGPHDYRFLQRMAAVGHRMTLVTFIADIDRPNFVVSGYDVRTIPGLDVRHRPDLAGRGWGILWRRRRFLKEVLDEVRPDVLHAGWLQTSGLISVLSGYRPLLLMPVGSDVLIEPFQKRTSRFLARWILRRGDLVTVDADSMQQAILEVSGLPSSRVQVIPWGIDTQFFHHDYDAEACKRSLGWAGRKVVLKNRTHRPVYAHADFLKAMARLACQVPELLVVVGSTGPLQNELKALASALGIGDRCLWPGYSDPETFRMMLRACDVYVNASLSDGVSASVQEAVATARPLVVTDIEGHRQFLVPGVHARYCRPGDPEDMALQVGTLLADQGLRKTMEDSLRAYDRTFLDRNRRIDQIAELYDGLVR